MGLSVIKILSGSINDEGKLKLNLRCQALMGMPSVGEAVYAGFIEADNHFYEILEVSNNETTGILDIVVYIGGPEFEQEWRDQWKPRINLGYNTAICWLTIKQARQLSVRGFRAQFVAFIELFNNETITRHVDEKFKPSIYLRIVKDKAINSLSKFGGLPFASPRFHFPSCPENESMVFICQIDLRELVSLSAATELNGDGILYLFATFDELKPSYGIKNVLIGYSTLRDDIQAIPLPIGHGNFGVVAEAGLNIFEKADLPQDDRFEWEESNFAEDDADLEEYLNWILCDYSLGDLYAMLRPDSHVSPYYRQSATEAYLKLNKQDSLNYKGQVISREGKIVVDYGEHYFDSFEWRHLFDFKLESTISFPLSNSPDRLLACDSGYTIMIRQKDLDMLNFNSIVLIHKRFTQY